MTRRSGIAALLCGFVIFATTAELEGQTFTGGLRGAVRDTQGVIPGASVTLTNQETNIARETVTNAVGEYAFPAVQPGTYLVTGSLPGYQTLQRDGITIGTQQFVTIDILLQVGAVEETILVTADSPLIQVSNASTGDVLSRVEFDELPAPGRNAFLVAITVPTVNPVGDPQFNRQQDQTNASRISIGGGGIRANNYLLDGVPITELVGRAVLNPSIEAIEEVKVQVHTYDSEMGRTGGGVFNITAKSGVNDFHGSAFFQTRPVWGQTLNHFNAVAGLTKEQTGLSDAYYRLYGGGFGGRLWQDRTFFWTASEGYRSVTTRNQSQIWPGLKQRNGDFSTSTIDGAAVQLYNPWCRGATNTTRCPATGTGSVATGGLFTGAIIPRTHPAASEVGFNLANAWPTETLQGAIGSNEDNNDNAIGTANLVDEADMWSLKIDHKFTNASSINALYVYNNTDEPGAFIMPESHAFMDTDHWILRRRPHVLVLNNTNVLNDSTVLTLRYGWTTWQDQVDKIPYTPLLGSLGFSSAFVGNLHEDGPDTFPDLNFEDLEDVGGRGGNRRRWNGPVALNGTLLKLAGSHSLKFGGDFRQLGISTTTESDMGGVFNFDSRFTSLNGVGGHELASMLLGLPIGGNAPYNRGEGVWFTRYFGAYIQDDWRVSSNFTFNVGLRIEHEDGLREQENRQTVAFNQTVTNPIDSLVPKTGTLLAGRTLMGGLTFAGVDGAPTQQGNQPTAKLSPRLGATYAVNDTTVIRGGYGLFYAPWQYSATQHGQIGFSRDTGISQSSAETEMPITTLDNPLPAGVQVPVGAGLGYLTGLGGTVNFIDQTKGAPRVHQYSFDIQKELANSMAITVGYVGSTGRDIGFGGTNNVGFNINQINPCNLPAAFGNCTSWDAAALRQSVANPFFGVAGTGEFESRATIQQGQLLRPFPQFGNVVQYERTAGGKRQYHALIFKIDKRMTTWWGGTFSYTRSRTMDNQFGESSTYQGRVATPQNNYDLDPEYGYSNFDSPHRIILAPRIRIPGPANENPLLTGWTMSAIVSLESGSPLNATLSSGTSNANLGLFGGRLRPNRIGDPNTSGSDTGRVASADHTDARWFDRNAFATPAAGQFGDSDRTHGDARLQFRKNIDFVLAKNTTVGDQTAQIRFEILNLTNTTKFGGASTSTNLSSFGRITSQRGFSRIWQMTFRYLF